MKKGRNARWKALLAIVLACCVGGMGFPSLPPLSAAASPLTAELLNNPGFESSGGWYGDNVTFNMKTTDKHTGLKSGFVSGRPEAGKGLIYGGNLKPLVLSADEGTYTVGAWMKLADAGATDTAVLQVYMNDNNVIRTFEVTGEVGNSWTYVTGTVPLEFSEYMGDIKLKIFTKNSTKDFYVDDSTFYKGTTYLAAQRPAAPGGQASGPDLSSLQYLKMSDDYRVFINGEEKFVYKSLNNAGGNARYNSMSFINFDTSGPAEVKIYPKAPVFEYQLRPYSYDIDSELTSDGMITFMLEPTKQVVLTLGENYDKALVICANPVEQAPQPSAVAQYYGPGVHVIGHWSEPGARGKLQSGDTVYIAEGAVVVGAFNANDRSNVKIYGRGIIYGGAYPHDEDFSSFVADSKTVDVENITVEGITFTNSPGWTIRAFSHDDEKKNVRQLTVRNVKQIGQWHYNTDGIQIGPDGFLIENNFLQSNDDNFSLNGACRNGEIRNNIHWVNRNGGVYTLGWGVNRIENIHIHDNVVYRYGSKLSIDAVFPLEMTKDIAKVKNIHYKDIIIEDLGVGTYWVDYRAKSRGSVQDITFENITILDSKPGKMTGYSSAIPINDVVFKNVTLKGVPVTDAASGQLTLTNVTNVQYAHDAVPPVLLPIASAQLSADKHVLVAGDAGQNTAKLTVSGKLTDQSNAPISQATVVYSSSAPDVVSVSTSGTAQALKAGSAVLSAAVTLNGATAATNSITFQVTESPLLSHNVVINGGFEGDGGYKKPPTGWTVTGDAAFYAQANGQYGNYSHSGQAYGNFYSSNPYVTTVTQTISNIPNGDYYFEMWYSGWERNSAYAGVKDYGGELKQVALTDQLNNQHKVSIDSIPVTNNQATIVVHLDGKGGKPLYIDDIVLMKKNGGTPPPAFEETAPGLRYTQGGSLWDAASGTLTFTKSGTIDGFFYQVPSAVKKVFIASNVTVTGGFLFSSSATIEGESWDTSVIYGTPEQRYSQNRGLNPWQLNAIEMRGNGTLHVKNLKSLNPKGYHISGYGSGTVIHVDHVQMIDDRGGDQNNGDGFVGTDGSSIRNSFISTGDDAIKLYRNMTIENVEIEMLHNGAPIQLGWNDDENQVVNASIKDLKVVGKSPSETYNLGVFSWVHGTTAKTRNLTIDGLYVNAPGAQLFRINSPNAKLNMNIVDANIITGVYGTVKSTGAITINGSTERSNYYSFDGSLPDPGDPVYEPSPYQATAVKGSPVVDGVKDDLWDAAPVIKTDKLRMGEGLTAAEYRMMWDEGYLYVLAQVQAAAGLNADNPNIWENDSIEVFVDEDNAKAPAYDDNDRHLIVSYTNKRQAFDTVGLEQVHTAAAADATSYTVEMKIPFLLPHQAGHVIGFDGQANSTGGTGNRVSISGWSGEQNLSDKTPRVWGELTLADEAGSGSDPVIGAEDMTITEGQSFVLPLTLRHTDGLGRLKAVIHYDPNRLTFKQITFKDILPLVEYNAETPGLIVFDGINEAGITSASELIAELEFTAKPLAGEESATMSILLDGIEAHTTLGAPYSITAQAAVITIDERIVFGDVNDDGRIDGLDALKLMRHLTNLETLTAEQAKAADYDGDGVLTTSDVLKILKKSVGLID
ncbi:sugar-binding protein [Paenibacillus sp. PL2-23]|uniref:sugar-binding protein n=1 Tax=Paenibacillus sp. PL2-23 TaxID=2100729 RepID=UPI0030FAB44A